MRYREATTEVSALMGRTWGGRRGRDPDTAQRVQGRFEAELKCRGAAGSCLWGTAPEHNCGGVKGKGKRPHREQAEPIALM